MRGRWDCPGHQGAGSRLDSEPRSDLPWTTAQAKLPATCGELVQGTLDGVPFLVSCPIDVYASVTVAIGPNMGSVEAGLVTQTGVDLDISKARAAVVATMRAVGAEGRQARLQIVSSVPRGKGLGSSTADVGGAILATAAALGRALEPGQLGRLAVSIEPSDSSLFPGLALFDHRGASLYEPLGAAPAMDILVLDGGGVVDTIAYNQQDRTEQLKRLAPQHRDALAALRAGLAAGDLTLVGQAATISARAHQAILFKPALEAVIALARQVGGLGVNVAHSGTVMGLLLDPRRSDTPAIVAYLQPRLPGLTLLYCTRLVDGGARICIG